jgi:acyl dehydratase
LTTENKMTIEGYNVHSAGDFVGQELGVTDWVVIDQDRIDRFADCTEDHQWIHVDAERAKQSPYGTTVAHGFLCLSLLAPAQTSIVVASDAGQVLNYGLDRVRFMAPVKVDSRIRTRVQLLSAEDKGPGRVLIKTKNTVEIEGEEKPALVAEMLVLMVAR